MSKVLSHNPLIPMGAITGKPTRDQLRKRLEDYRKVGIDQFLIYPRSGLELEYMSAEWLEACRHLIECAAEYDMAIWLYDEYNWPSGQCKGQVVKDNPGFHAQVLTARKEKSGQIIWEKVGCKDEADVLNPAAMRRFIALTHEKYFDCFKQHFGKTIRGIFTDEPNYICAVEKARKDTGALICLPYYEGLEDDYLKKSDRYLRGDIEQSLAGHAPENLWAFFYELIGERFIKAYFNPIKKWCFEHNILFTGHLTGEHFLGASVWFSGAPLQCIKELSLPGIDEIRTFTEVEQIEWLTLNMARYAALSRGTGALAELFALGPPDMPFGKLRQMFFLMAMHGVDHYVLAVSPLDARGNIEKYHYFTAFTPLQTYFSEMPLLQETAREAAVLAGRKLAPGIAVRFPSVLASIDAGASLIKGMRTDKERSSVAFNLLLQSMVRRQWPIRLIDEKESSKEAQVVISLEQNGWTLETADGALSHALTMEELFKQMEQRLERRVKVLEADNSLADNLLVEEYDDGARILNLTDQDRPQLQCQGKLFALPARGFKFINGKTVSEQKPLSVAAGQADLEFELFLDRSNLMRGRFYKTSDGLSFRFINGTENTIPGVKLLLRRYSNNVNATLDGKEIVCRKPCLELTPGLNELYAESETFTLSPIEHVLRLSGGEKDEMFLPLALLAGKFGVYPGFILKELPAKVGIGYLSANGLLNYAGKISLKTTLSVPENAELLRLNTGEQITAVRLDGKSLGTRAWAPFEWQIPSELKGKQVVCEIIQTLSIGAIFGEYDPNSAIPRPALDYLPGKFTAAGCLMPLEWLCHTNNEH